MICPGLDSRFLRVGIHRCPYCGYGVEIFSDEIRVKCPKCKKYVYRDKIPSCIDWCKFAKDCIGEERWQELVEHRKTRESHEKKGKK